MRFTRHLSIIFAASLLVAAQVGPALAAYSISSSSLAGALPALDGSALTNLNASNAASGTLAIARGGTGASSLASAGIAQLSVAQTFSAAQQMGGSAVATPLNIFRDNTAGATTNAVQLALGNGNSGQGNLRITFTNAAASGAQSTEFGFYPRKNDDTTAINPCRLTMTKTAGADTALVDLVNGSNHIYMKEDGNSGVGTTSPTEKWDVNGNLQLKSAGNIIKIKEGSNASMGLATLVAGTVTVSNTLVTANTRVFYSVQTPGGTQGFLSVARSAGASFTLNSTSATETSTVAWHLIEPSP